MVMVEAPAIVRAETLGKYADILRVGRLVVNGIAIGWDTRMSNDEQLVAFCNSYTSALRQLPELAVATDEALVNSAHLVCKALSINYALSEVLQLLRQKLGEEGATCTIKAKKLSGQQFPVDYGIDILPGRIARAYVNWKGRGNILTCDPRTAKMKVRGTLSHVETEFPLEPSEHGFKPTYRFHIEYHSGSRISQLTSIIAQPFKCSAGISPQHRRPVSLCPTEDLASLLGSSIDDRSELDYEIGADEARLGPVASNLEPVRVGARGLGDCFEACTQVFNLVSPVCFHGLVVRDKAPRLACGLQVLAD